MIAPNNTAVTKSAIGAGYYEFLDSKTLAFHAMSVDENDGNKVHRAAEGTYTIDVAHYDPSKNGLHSIKQTITITDDTNPVVYKVRKDIDASTCETVTEAAIKMYQFEFNGIKLNNADEEEKLDDIIANGIDIKLGDAKNVYASSETSKTYVKTITFFAQLIKDSDYKVQVTVPINNFVEHKTIVEE